MQKRHFLYIMALAALTACNNDDNAVNDQQDEAVVYNVNIAATIGEEIQTPPMTPPLEGNGAAAAETRAVSLNTETGALDATFQTTDGIFVYDKTTGCYSFDNTTCAFMLLRPDKNGPTANLTGTARFYSSSGVRNDPEVGHELMLIYGVRYNGIGNNPTLTHFNYSGQPGTLAGLSSYDFAIADVTIESIEGNNSSGFTLTTTNADFQNQQSMFKISFTGLPEGEKAASFTVHSKKDKLVQTYDPATGTATYGDVTITLNDAARAANGDGVVYAALRFDALAADEQDDITFTVITTNDHIYSAMKTTPLGGFQRGKYYNASDIQMMLKYKVGWYLNKDGSVTATKQTGDNPSYAVIASVGKVEHYFDEFLAIALEDASRSHYYWNVTPEIINTFASNHPITINGQTYKTNAIGNQAYDIFKEEYTTNQTRNDAVLKGWRLPCITDWRYIFQDLCGGPSATDPAKVPVYVAYGNGAALRAAINSYSNSDLDDNSMIYWTSTCESDGFSWDYCFNFSEFASDINRELGGNMYLIRAVFAY